jgi:hypothetical protein
MALVENLRTLSGAEADVDRAAQRQAMDVIGRVGFGRQFDATEDLTGQPGHLGGEEDPFDLLTVGNECMK